MTRSPLILVIDDNDSGLLLVRSVLELDGFRVNSASSSEEALQRLTAQAPDLILMDVQLPGQDGLALTRQLKADPGTSSIPIVALTAHVMPGDRDQALDAGCTGFISKPINTRTFSAQVWECLPAEPREAGPSAD